MTTSGQPPRDGLRPLLLLWLAGMSLRFTILAVPPVIPNIHDDLAMSATQVGLLGGLPPMMLALAAVPGSLLIARLGTTSALVTGLLIAAAGGALRGTIQEVVWLYAMTIVMSAGVAIMQVAMPPAVRAWQPRRIGFATAVYTNGLLIGEIVPVALMLPVVMSAFSGNWAKSLALWSVPVAVTALIILAAAPKAPAAATTRRRWWPDWTSPLIWQLGLMLGMINTLYFATNAFLPDYLRATGNAALISPALTALNAGQLPASFILLAVAQKMERKAWPYVVFGALCVLGIAAVLYGNSVWILVGAGVVGFAGAGGLILALALPPLLAPPDDVHRVTAAMFTISYSTAIIVPVISGASWDITGSPVAAFVPIGLCAVLLMLFAPAVTRAGHPH